MSLFEHSPRPIDERWEYEAPEQPFLTSLHQQLLPVKSMLDLNASFAFSLDASAKLGQWCSDRVWHYSLSESEYSKLLGRYERTDAFKNLKTVQEKQEAMAIIRRAKEAAMTNSFENLTTSPKYLSSKVLLLHQMLSQHYSQNKETRCIVFVEQRLTAKILADVFSTLSMPNLRAGILVGVSGNTIVGQTETWKQHDITMDKFRAGILNCA